VHRPIPSPESTPTQRTVPGGGSRGQSLVEFALVIPILLMLFVAIADFGRVFVAGVTLEAATRDAAEAAANRYVATPPGPLESPAPGNHDYYVALRTYAAGVVCAEMRGLPGTNYDPGPPSPSCPDMPVVVVCVHDAADDGCTSQASPGSGGIPGGCTDLTTWPNNAPVANSDGTHSRWVEVRTCYHFTPLLNLPLFSLGDFWLERTRNFTIPCWFVLSGAECG
jgi:TadE-like protein